MRFNSANPPFPEVETSQGLCESATVSELIAIGENIWYDSAEGGIPLSGEVELITGTYYVTQTLEDCESQPVEVHVIIYDTPSPPVADPDQALCAGGTIGDLIATGEDIRWYDVQEGEFH